MIISHRHKFAFFRIPKTGSSTADTMLRLCGAFNKTDYMSGVAGLSMTVPKPVIDHFENQVRETVAADWKKNGRNADDPSSKETLDAIVKAGSVSLLVHITPTLAIEHNLITLEQLKEYNCFAYLRDPLDRQLSAYTHRKQGVPIIPQMFHLDMEHGVDLSLLNKPQADYFYVGDEVVLQPLDFLDYANELRRIIALVGGYHFEEIPQLNPASRPRGLTKDAYYTPEIEQKVSEYFTRDVQLYQNMRLARDANS